jgi:hypothetical protein
MWLTALFSESLPKLSSSADEILDGSIKAPAKARTKKAANLDDFVLSDRNDLVFDVLCNERPR